MTDWLRVTTINGDDYECHMTVLKADDTTITVTRPWHHHWTDGWDWKTIIRQWLSDVPETFEPYDGLVEWLRDVDVERIGCWHCLSTLANHRRSAVASLSNAEKKRLASRLDFGRKDGEGRQASVRSDTLREVNEYLTWLDNQFRQALDAADADAQYEYQEGRMDAFDRAEAAFRRIFDVKKQ